MNATIKAEHVGAHWNCHLYDLRDDSHTSCSVISIAVRPTTLLISAASETPSRSIDDSNISFWSFPKIMQLTVMRAKFFWIFKLDL